MHLCRSVVGVAEAALPSHTISLNLQRDKGGILASSGIVTGCLHVRSLVPRR